MTEGRVLTDEEATLLANADAHDIHIAMLDCDEVVGTDGDCACGRIVKSKLCEAWSGGFMVRRAAEELARDRERLVGALRAALPDPTAGRGVMVNGLLVDVVALRHARTLLENLEARDG